jgi:hypothetical protein
MSADEVYGAVAIAAKETFLKKQPAPRMVIALLLSIINRFADSGRQVSLDYQARNEGYLLLALLAMEQGDVKACDGYLDRLQELWDRFEKAGSPQLSPHRTTARQMRALIRR